MPKSNREFWEDKFARNVERDARKTRELEGLGWTVITVWECQLREDPASVLSDLARVLGSIPQE
jgi:DNA mismatch endonuclease, patch repair protein